MYTVLRPAPAILFREDRENCEKWMKKNRLRMLLGLTGRDAVPSCRASSQRRPFPYFIRSPDPGASLVRILDQRSTRMRCSLCCVSNRSCLLWRHVCGSDASLLKEQAIEGAPSDNSCADTVKAQSWQVVNKGPLLGRVRLVH